MEFIWAFLGVFTVMAVFMLLVWIVCLACQYKIHQKAYLPGWTGLVPVYNKYMMSTKIGCEKLFLRMVMASLIPLALGFLLLLITPICNFIHLSMISTVLSYIADAIRIVCSLYVTITTIMFNYHLAKAFGQGIGFTVGLILLPIVFIPILAFGPAKFVGSTEPATDVIDIIIGLIMQNK